MVQVENIGSFLYSIYKKTAEIILDCLKFKYYFSSNLLVLSLEINFALSNILDKPTPRMRPSNISTALLPRSYLSWRMVVSFGVSWAATGRSS